MTSLRLSGASNCRGIGAAAFLALAVSACAQQGEVGGLFGYGAYRNGTVFSADGTAAAGVRNRFAAGAVICEDLYEHLSGELQYLYQDGHPFVSAGVAKADVNGGSHAIHYDLLFHVRPRDSRWRPFFAAGAGAKFYRPNGPVPAVQPLPNIVTLTNDTQWRFLVTAGVGVKYRLRNHLILRAEFLDYITPFPKRIYVPAPGGTDRGLLEQFTPVIGVSYGF